MKKILFVIQSLRIGGGERVLVTIANKLAEVGYDVTILIWLPRYTFRDDLDPRVHLIYKAPDQHLGNRIPYIRYKFYDDSMWLLRATPRMLHRYYVGRKKYDVEIAFFHGYALDIVGGSPDKKSLKIAWVHHDIQKLDDAKPAAWERTVEMYRKMDRIVCVSESSRRSFINAIGDTNDIRVIYNMLPIEEIRRKAEEEPKQQIPRSGFHMVMISRFKSAKGYKRLIESVVRLRKEGRDVSLALIGEGDEEGLMRQLIGENSADGYISVLNGQNNPYPYIKGADLLVCASFTEGYNLTVAEAMILGVPVLSTDCAGPREILDNGKYGLLVDNDAEALYEGLKKLCDSPELLAEYRQKAIDRQGFFDEEKILCQITDLIEGK